MKKMTTLMMILTIVLTLSCDSSTGIENTKTFFEANAGILYKRGDYPTFDQGSDVYVEFLSNSTFIYANEYYEGNGFVPVDINCFWILTESKPNILENSSIRLKYNQHGTIITWSMNNGVLTMDYGDRNFKFNKVDGSIYNFNPCIRN